MTDPKRAYVLMENLRIPLTPGPIPLLTGWARLITGPIPLPTGRIPLLTGWIPLTTGRISLPTGRISLLTGWIPLTTGPISLPGTPAQVQTFTDIASHGSDTASYWLDTAHPWPDTASHALDTASYGLDTAHHWSNIAFRDACAPACRSKQTTRSNYKCNTVHSTQSCLRDWPTWRTWTYSHTSSRYCIEQTNQGRQQRTDGPT